MYYLCKELGLYCIRYWKDGQNCRLPIVKYRSIRDNESELQQLIARLNAPELAKEIVTFKHAFINQSLLDTYKDHLCQQIPNQENARTEYYYLVKYALNFFIGQLNIINPLDWPNYQNKWYDYLVTNKCPGSAKTKRAIVQSLNRFTLWLQSKRPLEITKQLIFNPISKAQYKMIDAMRELNGDKIPSKDITKGHWQTILDAASQEISPHITLAYLYGLRRAEILGLKLDDVKTDCLSVERQLINTSPEYGPLKGRKKRFVPHWFSTPEACYNLINRMKLMHPDTLTSEWGELIDLLELDYRFHDIRHAWTTNCWTIPGLLPKQIQDAAGHENIETTMGYTHSDKTLGKVVFRP